MPCAFNNSPIQDYVNPDGHIPPTYEMIPVFKPLTMKYYYLIHKKFMSNQFYLHYYYEIVYIVFSYLLHMCIFRSILNIVYLLSSFRIVKSYWLIVLCIYISY